MTRPKLLLVDDNHSFRQMLQAGFEDNGFEVVTAASVPEALSQIVAQLFDVLVTDLQMPGPGDGFAVVTAMHHSQPEALTLVVSGFPDVQAAMSAIALQADEVIAKPFDVKQVSALIRDKRQGQKPSARLDKQSVASILERESNITIQHWLSRVKRIDDLSSIRLSDEERTVHLHEMTVEIAARLRRGSVLETVPTSSPAAAAHGRVRFRQGYTAPLIVQESRILQVSIFETIQRNLAAINFSTVLSDIMIIADEVDSQLAQCVESFLGMSRDAAA